MQQHIMFLLSPKIRLTLAAFSDNFIHLSRSIVHNKYTNSSFVLIFTELDAQ